MEEYSFDMSVISRHVTEGDAYNMSYPISISTLLSKLNFGKKDQEIKEAMEREFEEENTSCEVERNLLIKPVVKENSENLEALYQSLKRGERNHQSEIRLDKLTEKIDGMETKALKSERNMNMPLVRNNVQNENRSKSQNQEEINRNKGLYSSNRNRETETSQDSIIRKSMMEVRNLGLKALKNSLTVRRELQGQNESLRTRDLNRTTHSKEKEMKRLGQERKEEKQDKNYLSAKREITTMKNVSQNKNDKSKCKTLNFFSVY